MMHANWDWSDIVNPDLVEQALAAQRRRDLRRQRRSDDDHEQESACDEPTLVT